MLLRSLVLVGSAPNFVLQNWLALSPVGGYCHLGLEALAGSSMSEPGKRRLSDNIEPRCWGQIVVEDFGPFVAPGKQFGPEPGLDGLVVLVKLQARLQ